jgi:hypothetical protein
MALPTEVPIEVLLSGFSDRLVDAEAFGNFLRDLTFLHDRLCLLSTNELNVKDLNYSYFFTRKGRQIPPEYRLKLVSLQKNNPWEAHLVIGAFLAVPAAGWAFFQIIRAIKMLPGERRLQNLAVERAEIENARSLLDIHKTYPPPALAEIVHPAVETLLENGLPPDESQPAAHLIARDLQRLLESPIQVTNTEIRKSVKVADLKKTAEGAGR